MSFRRSPFYQKTRGRHHGSKDFLKLMKTDANVAGSADEADSHNLESETDRGSQSIKRP
jgi:hypothetical protein